MNKEYDSENGGGSEMSETKRSRWHISSDTRSVLTVVAVVLAGLGAVWAVCQHTVSRLETEFHQQNARMDRIESTMAEGARQSQAAMAEGARQSQAAMAEGFRQSQAAMTEGFRLSHARMDRIESAMAEGFRLSHARMDRTDVRIDRLEQKLDAIDAFLREGRLPVGVEGGESTPAPAAKPGGFSATSSWPLLGDR